MTLKFDKLTKTHFRVNGLDVQLSVFFSRDSSFGSFAPTPRLGVAQTSSQELGQNVVLFHPVLYEGDHETSHLQFGLLRRCLKSEDSQYHHVPVHDVATPQFQQICELHA